MHCLSVCLCHQVVTRLDGCLWILGGCCQKSFHVLRSEFIMQILPLNEKIYKQADEFG